MTALGEGIERPRRSRALSRSRRMTIIQSITAFVIVIIALQLWLFTASMNAYLGGNRTILLPAALVSGVCFGLNVGLLRYLYRLER